MQRNYKPFAMSDVTYKIRVNRPCRLFIDDEEIAILEELKLTKFTLPRGEYLRKVVAIDNDRIYDETEIILSGNSKLENLTLDTVGLDHAKLNALPMEKIQIGDLYYKATENKKGVAVVGCINKELSKIVVPAQVSYANYLYDVIAIGKKAFHRCCSLTSIILPNSLTNIEFGAFLHCESLPTITIPNSVVSIEWWAFGNCQSLTSIVIPDGITSVEEVVFENCKSLSSVIIPDSVTIIKRGAFSGCSSLNSIIIPDKVICIDQGAFSHCSNLTSITIPNSVTEIEDSAFSGCSSLVSIKVDINNSVYDSRNDCNAIIETTINTLVAGCKNTIIPNNITTIGREAFSFRNSLTSIIIPDSVTTIEAWAFYSCKNLEFISIPNSVTSVREGAFCDCIGLSSITIGNNVTQIGSETFKGCSNLSTIVIPYSVISIGQMAFNGCSSLTSIKVDKNNNVYDSRNDCNAIIKTATNTLVAGCKNTIIPNNVTEIERVAFGNCTSLLAMTIPDSVIWISDAVFSYCSSLTSINVDENNKIYDSRDNCNAIIKTATNALVVGCKNTIIPSSVTWINNGAFWGHVGLISIVIPNNVRGIGDWAFAHCSSLVSINIPISVRNIEYSAFCGCKSLTSITYQGTKLQWRAIKKGDDWCCNSALKMIRCTDGNIELEVSHYAPF